jgi:hypothetical protein
MSLYYKPAMILDKKLFLIGTLVLVILISIVFSNVETFDNGEPIPILNLVLYSSDGGGPYDRMQKMTSEYYKKFPFVTTYYYCFKSDLDKDFDLKGDILYVKGDESFIPGILKKTIDALEYFKDEIPKYKYVVRNNISTIIRFDLLEKDLRKNAVGYGCALCWNMEYNKRKQDLPENTIIFSSGTSIIFSPDVLLNIINNKDKIDMGKIDDASIGEFVQNEMPEVEMQPVLKNTTNYGFHFVPNLNEDKEKIKGLIKDNKIIFFRNHNGNRELDANQMRIIIEVLNEDAPAYE